MSGLAHATGALARWSGELCARAVGSSGGSLRFELVAAHCDAWNSGCCTQCEVARDVVAV